MNLSSSHENDTVIFGCNMPGLDILWVGTMLIKLTENQKEREIIIKNVSNNDEQNQRETMH